MRYFTCILAMILAIASVNSYANASAEKKTEGASNYFRFDPDFVTNIGKDRELRYVKVRIDVEPENANKIELIKFNEPMIRDQVLKLFNESDLENFKSPEKIQELKEKVRVIINDVVKKESHEENVAKKVLFGTVITE